MGFVGFSRHKFVTEFVMEMKKYRKYGTFKDGSNGARTHDLSRVRRTLIPAELCFRICTKRQSGMPSFLFGVIIKEHSKADKAFLYKMDPKGFEPSASALRTRRSPN